MSPENKQDLNEAVSDIQNLFPNLGKTGTPTFRNPKDASKKADFNEAAKKFDRAVVRATKKAVPAPVCPSTSSCR